MSGLKWLENWYLENCDGDREHGYGIKIETLDNPGWAVDIHLDGTWLEDKMFQIIKIDRTEMDWVYCSVSDNIFKGNGGPNNLEGKRQT
ncbi:immunity 53 family protein [Paenibacillus sp. 19GGS1-52]|uniref:immunity 53 family protein n=1 Tax=Paenibacillus sp. 19GGS1-52 TaxID=2758563 RepID=UPI001EFA9C3C|nr:immunity 53 family protein [Paenibacillus sp. 19GGS1-52]ULO09522.1 immunity 53 family protein [Paenibacillus sp. 19GGS1-52]